jgi:hypothetical protein
MGQDTINASQAGKYKTGLVGHWTFDGGANTKMIGTGGTAYDSSGQNNTGQISGATQGEGKLGQGLSFNGTTSYINAGSAASLANIETQGGGGMTVSAWIKPRSAGEGNAGSIACKSEPSSGTAGSWCVYISSAATTHLEFFKDFNGATDLQSWSANSSIALNAWQHIVVTWNGGTSASSGIKYYVNNSLVSHVYDQDGAGSGVSDSSNALYLGNSRWNATTFDGQLDDVRIYNRALSVQEVGDLYRLGHATIKK